MTVSRPEQVFAALPDPGQAGTLDEVVEGLRFLKVWAGDPSYDTIKDRVNAAWTEVGRPGGELAKRTTVADCFKTGRRRLNTDLVLAVVNALHPDVGYVTQWRQALRVVGGETEAAAQVRVQDALPPDLVGFTGRGAELEQLRSALNRGRNESSAVVISAIAGMAGVGKTQLAIHAGHLLAGEKPFDRILFVNLRGFHPDSTQPPADPSAVLDGFLRLLGVPGTQIPHDPAARAAAYRSRMTGANTLVILDNAADAEQVRPLLPLTPGCPVLVTSRRDLSDLHPATHLTVDVFTPDEALAFLARAAPRVSIGDDPDAPVRIVRRCGYLPLALGLVAGHIRGTPGWTLTDHADRLDERHRDRRLETGVQLALDLSYQHLPADRQRLLRLVALHPGQDLDPHAAAALSGLDLSPARDQLRDLCGDHLLQEGTGGRYTVHDLVRAYAAGRGSDEDPPSHRRAALTRLFDFYLATAAAAMDILAPAEAHRRPRVPLPATPASLLADPDTALAWLDTERPTLVAVAAHTASHGWPVHTVRLSTTLFRYLDGGHSADALVVHGHARHAAHDTDDPAGQAHALTNLGSANLQLGRYEPAVDQLRQALALYRQTGDRTGEARALGNLGLVEVRQGRYRPAAERYQRAMTLFQQLGDRTGEARALGNLGRVEVRLGRYQPAADHYEQALTLYRQAGDRIGQADALHNLGVAEVGMGRYGPAAEHLQRALIQHRRLGNRDGEASTLDGLGILHTRLGRPGEATEHHQRALAICRETGIRDGEAWTLNGLGEAARVAGRPSDARTHHTAAHAVAVAIGDRDQQARAHTGLGHAHRALDDPARARRHYQHALTLYTDLDLPDADQVRAHLVTVEDSKPER